MEYKFLDNKISLEKEDKEVAYLLFIEEDKTVEVVRTFVDDNLRGQGIASILMEKIYNYANEKDKRIVPTCSYAKEWLNKKGV